MPGRFESLRPQRSRPFLIAVCTGLLALLLVWIGGSFIPLPKFNSPMFAQPPATPDTAPEPNPTQPQTPDPAPTAENPQDSAPLLVAPDIQGILDRGELIVGLLGQDSPPFFVAESAAWQCPAEEGKFIKQADEILCGADIELGLAIAQQLEVEVRFDRRAETFNDVVDEVFNREVDLAFSKISRTMSRVRNVSFSRPYVNMRQGLLLNRVQLAKQAKGRQPAEVLRDLEGEIGVIEASSYVGFTEQKFPAATVKEYSDWQAVVQAARDGEIVAAYRDELEVKKIIRTNPDTALNFQTVALTDTNDAIAAVLPWDSRHLQEFVNQYLETINADYTADQLLENYAYMFEKQPRATASE